MKNNNTFSPTGGVTARIIGREPYVSVQVGISAFERLGPEEARNLGAVLIQLGSQAYKNSEDRTRPLPGFETLISNLDRAEAIAR